MNFLWNHEKNKVLKTERDVCYVDIVTTPQEASS